MELSIQRLVFGGRGYVNGTERSMASKRFVDGSRLAKDGMREARPVCCENPNMEFGTWNSEHGIRGHGRGCGCGSANSQGPFEDGKGWDQ